MKAVGWGVGRFVSAEQLDDCRHEAQRRHTAPPECVQERQGGHPEPVVAHRQGGPCTDEREGGICLNHQVARERRNRQCGQVLPRSQPEHPKHQANQHNNRKGKPSCCHICLKLVSCHELHPQSVIPPRFPHFLPSSRNFWTESPPACSGRFAYSRSR